MTDGSLRNTTSYRFPVRCTIPKFHTLSTEAPVGLEPADTRVRQPRCLQFVNKQWAVNTTKSLEKSKSVITIGFYLSMALRILSVILNKYTTLVYTNKSI